MTALEKIFQGYYEGRMDGEEPEPEAMQVLHMKILEALEYLHVKESGNIMEAVSQYGMEAEKAGFMAGFKMAWELLKNLQEGTELD